MFSLLWNLIKAPFPAIAEALLGKSVTETISDIGKTLFGDDTLDSESLYERLKNNPELLINLKELEFTYQIDKIKEENNALQMKLLDVQDARNMNIKTKGNFVEWLAILVLLSIMVMFSTLIFVPVPQEVFQIVLILITNMMAAFVGIIGFFYGSNKNGIKTKVTK